MVNVQMMREVADRIDPETRLGDIAGFDQTEWGTLLDEEFFAKAIAHFSSSVKPLALALQLIEGVAECDTACCIAGHAFILAEGTEKYLEWMRGRGNIALYKTSANALRLTEGQAQTLFRANIGKCDIEENFGVKLKGIWNTTKDATVIATMLRQIADEYANEEEDEEEDDEQFENFRAEALG